MFSAPYKVVILNFLPHWQLNWDCVISQVENSFVLSTVSSFVSCKTNKPFIKTYAFCKDISVKKQKKKAHL